MIRAYSPGVIEKAASPRPSCFGRQVATAIYGVAYVIALVIFAAMDGTWLTVMGSRLYKPVLEPLLLPTVNIGPAVGFYLLYTVGLVVFAITPALKADLVLALVFGALLGAVAYGTYDLTNFAAPQSVVVADHDHRHLLGRFRVGGHRGVDDACDARARSALWPDALGHFRFCSNNTHIVIPGRALLRASPESITTFRAISMCRTRVSGYPAL